MNKVQKSIIIDAPPEQVFSYVLLPESLIEIWPGITAIRDVKWLPNTGKDFLVCYKLGGILIECSSKDVEVIPNQRIVNKVQGGIQSTVTWDFFSYRENQTLVTFEIEYSLPTGFVGRMAEAVLLRMNDKEAEVILFNLQLRMEFGPIEP